MASRVTRVRSSIWFDKRFRGVSSFSQLVYLYLITCPHGNARKPFSIHIDAATADLMCSASKYCAALKNLKNVGLIAYDGKSICDLGEYAENHWNWKGGITPEQNRIRHCGEYKAWRKKVFERDRYTCQKCGVRGGRLRAHHKKAFSKYPALRFAVSNGITYCESCHREHHRRCGI